MSNSGRLVGSDSEPTGRIDVRATFVKSGFSDLQWELWRPAGPDVESLVVFGALPLVVSSASIAEDGSTVSNVINLHGYRSIGPFVLFLTGTRDAGRYVLGGRPGGAWWFTGSAWDRLLAREI
jgi:hypothetical protein